MSYRITEILMEYKVEFIKFLRIKFNVLKINTK